ncbi:hypothetical protein C0992_005009 [Termitomyces sp. T32_za158]|nr:hypothetical protein C0992_005009 [Termitomyces sp. T32_za158]
MSLSTRSGSRLSACDPSTPSSRRSQSSTPPSQPPAAATKAPSSPRSPSRSTPSKKRSRGESKTSKQRTRKRKNCTDMDERRRQLEADPWTLEVRSRIVRCLGCKRWIKLDQRNEYYSGLWAKHRDLCRGVKMMKGEVLPKRTRRSKKKPAASPAATDSASATTPAPEKKPATASKTTPAHPEILSTHSGSPSLTESSLEDVPRSRAHSEAAIASDRAYSYPPSSNPYPQPPLSSGTAYHWPQYVPYGYGPPFHYAYYPVAHPVKLPPISAMTRSYSPAPYEHEIEDDDNMDVDTDVDDVRRFAFGPGMFSASASIYQSGPDVCVSDVASHNDCHGSGHGCQPRFRYSTRHEIETYFDGATLDSMAKRLSCPADDMTYHGAVCLLSLRKK